MSIDTSPIVLETRSGGLYVYGNGSDGNVTISTNTAITRDMYYDNLTINAGINLDPSGYRIFVKNTLTFGGAGASISRLTNTATTGTVGGGFGIGAAANSSLGGASGDKTVTQNAGTTEFYYDITKLLSGLYYNAVTQQFQALRGGAGGSTGAAGNTGTSGTSNAGSAGSVGSDPTNANIVGASGGRGYSGNAGVAGTGGAGGAGGAGAAGGGVLVVLARIITGTGTISARGGGGSAGASGSSGNAGTPGTTGAAAPPSTYYPIATYNPVSYNFSAGTGSGTFNTPTYTFSSGSSNFNPPTYTFVPGNQSYNTPTQVPGNPAFNFVAGNFLRFNTTPPRTAVYNPPTRPSAGFNPPTFSNSLNFNSPGTVAFNQPSYTFSPGTFAGTNPSNYTFTAGNQNNNSPTYTLVPSNAATYNTITYPGGAGGAGGTANAGGTGNSGSSGFVGGGGVVLVLSTQSLPGTVSLVVTPGSTGATGTSTSGTAIFVQDSVITP